MAMAYPVMALVGVLMLVDSGSGKNGPGWIILLMLIVVSVCMWTEKGRLQTWHRIGFVFLSWILQTLLGLMVYLCIGIFLGPSSPYFDSIVAFLSSVPIVIFAMRQSRLFVATAKEIIGASETGEHSVGHSREQVTHPEEELLEDPIQEPERESQLQQEPQTDPDLTRGDEKKGNAAPAVTQSTGFVTNDVAETAQPIAAGESTSSTMTIELGMTLEKVIELQGEAPSRYNLGSKTILIYESIKMTFQDGRLVDAE